MPTGHTLDNIIWNSMVKYDGYLADHNGSVGVFRPDIAPFAGMSEYSSDYFEQLYEILPMERTVVLFLPDPIVIPINWEILQTMLVEQMEYHGSKDIMSDSDINLKPLDQSHVKAMQELTKLTNPGPFFENTILFGNYFGIFDGERLVSMAGIRFNAGLYREISAVCTHPDFKGKGYAAKLIRHLISIIHSRDCIPFLHVKNENTGAIKLYQQLGFIIRHQMKIYVIKKKV